MKRYLLVAISVFVSGCYKSGPPKGFEAIVPPTAHSAEFACPNLIDTYLMGSLEGSNALFDGSIQRAGFSYFVIESLSAGRNYNYTLKMDRAQFIFKAQDLKAKSPGIYALWRESTLLLSKNYSADLLAKAQQYGPVYAHKAQIRSHRCKNGWAKVREINTRVWDTKTDSEYIKQDDVWLARDKYGDLLIHTISYRQKPGWTFWAAGGGGTRLIQLYEHWAKMKKVSDADLSSDWTEADLPISQRAIHNVGQCILPNQIIDFIERLLQRGSFIEGFDAQPVTVKDGACVQPPMRLTFSTANSTEGKKIIQSLTDEPIVNHVEIIETQYSNGRLLYTVELRINADAQ